MPTVCVFPLPTEPPKHDWRLWKSPVPILGLPTKPLFGGALPLHSKPGASARLLLNFDGSVISQWNGHFGFTVRPFNNREDNQVISYIWQRVAYDYRQFDIDVSTDVAASDSRPTAFCYIGGAYTDWFGSSAGGVSVVGGFRFAYLGTGYEQCFIFSESLGDNPKYVADAASHEDGHLFGLEHQSIWSGGVLINEYRSDGPIMGIPYSAANPFWTIGPTPSSETVLQDDVATIGGSPNGFGFTPALGDDGFMSATNVFENGLLSLIFENSNYANVGDATGLRGSSTAGVFYISLHTTTTGPGEAGSQTTNEAAYTSYARQSVVRSTSGWTVASGVCDNDGVITFPQATGGTETEQSFGIGSDVSGAGNAFLWGALGASLAVSTGITPSFAIGALDITLD